MGKLVKVTVTTPKGDRFLTYQPTEEDDKDIVCLRGCVYKDICDKIRDPRNPEDTDGTFTDFCSDIGKDFTDEEKQKEISSYVPVPGTIESGLYDSDIVQDLIKKNPQVSVNKVIDNVCPGWCDSYNKEHTNCTADNGMCILRSIFIKSNSHKNNE